MIWTILYRLMLGIPLYVVHGTSWLILPMFLHRRLWTARWLCDWGLHTTKDGVCTRCHGSMYL